MSSPLTLGNSRVFGSATSSSHSQRTAEARKQPAEVADYQAKFTELRFRIVGHDEAISDDELREIYQQLTLVISNLPYCEISPTDSIEKAETNFSRINDLLSLTDDSKARQFHQEQFNLACALVKSCLSNFSIEKNDMKQSLLPAMAYYSAALNFTITFSFPPSEIQHLHDLASQLVVYFIEAKVIEQEIFLQQTMKAVGRVVPDVNELEQILRAFNTLLTYRCNEEDNLVFYKLFNQIRQALDVPIKDRRPLTPIFKTIGELSRDLGPLPYERMTQRYRKGLDQFRASFDPFRPMIRRHRIERADFASLTNRFVDFFKSEILHDAFTILGPPPCHYEIIAMGSVAREEVSPFSDLELFILIEDHGSENRKSFDYFNRLTQLMELQLLSFGETAGEFNRVVFTALGKENLSGFHLDKPPRLDHSAALSSQSSSSSSESTVLNLGFNQIGPAGAASLARSLELNSSLTVLSLQENKIGDAGASSLARSLELNSSLTVLSLQENKIGDAGKASLDQIKQALARNKIFKKNQANLSAHQLDRTEFEATVSHIHPNHSEGLTDRIPSTDALEMKLTSNISQDPITFGNDKRDGDDEVPLSSHSNEVLFSSVKFFEEGFQFIYDHAAYKHVYSTRGDGACAMHALLGTKEREEYVWNPTNLALDDGHQELLQRLAKQTFNDTIESIFNDPSNLLRKDLFHCMEEALKETAPFIAWDARFQRDLEVIKTTIVTQLTGRFYQDHQAVLNPIFQKTPDDHAKLLNTLQTGVGMVESLLNCVYANITELKAMEIDDPVWATILELERQKQERELEREQRIPEFLASHFEDYLQLILDSSYYLSFDELKLAAQLLKPNAKVIVFYDKDAPPHVINPGGTEELIAIEHSMAHAMQGRHFSRLEPFTNIPESN